jgi:DNA-binding NarL/FixJ family response regulator
MIRVLLADDHETVREGLRLLIDAQPDMQVTGEAADGAEAVDKAAALKPDAIVLDLTMPGTSGLTAAYRLKVAAPATAVVALTRHHDPTYVQTLLGAGASAYVLKQSTSAQLLHAIRVAASGGRYLDPALLPPDQPRDPRRRDSTPLISEREREILRLIAVGNSNKEVANTLNISVKTVEAHKSNAMRKLGLRGRTDVVRYAMLNDWLRDV